MESNKLYQCLQRMRSTVPPGERGNWAVVKFEVSKEEARFFNLRQSFHSHRDIEAGSYTKLTYCDCVIMSDTPAEVCDCLWFMHEAEGDVLVNGLGLGLVVEGLMLNPDVKHVTVIEIAPEVIQLVGQYLKGKYNGRLSIINADAFEWKPPKGKVYDLAWHDIWDTICGDHYEGMKKLHRKYARKAKCQSSWCREKIKRRSLA